MDRAENLAARVREIFQSSPDQPRGRIESFLAQELGDLDSQSRLEVVKAVRLKLASPRPAPESSAVGDQDVLSRLMSLLLGSRISDESLSSPDVLAQLGKSLNVLFDTLNELIQTVEENLKGRPDTSATIRTVIASEVSGAETSRPLHEHLNQIKEAFLVAHKSFLESGSGVMREVLDALSPEKLETKVGGGLKFGALRKAQLFELYKAQYENIVMWFETGRFRDYLVREFEKNCERFSTNMK